MPKTGRQQTTGAVSRSSSQAAPLRRCDCRPGPIVDAVIVEAVMVDAPQSTTGASGTLA